MSIMIISLNWMMVVAIAYEDIIWNWKSTGTDCNFNNVSSAREWQMYGINCQCQLWRLLRLTYSRRDWTTGFQIWAFKLGFLSTTVLGHFGTRTLLHQTTGAKVSGHFGTNFLVPNCLIVILDWCRTVFNWCRSVLIDANSIRKTSKEDKRQRLDYTLYQ